MLKEFCYLGLVLWGVWRLQFHWILVWSIPQVCLACFLDCLCCPLGLCLGMPLPLFQPIGWCIWAWFLDFWCELAQCLVGVWLPPSILWSIGVGQHSLVQSILGPSMCCALWLAIFLLIVSKFLEYSRVLFQGVLICVVGWSDLMNFPSFWDCLLWMSLILDINLTDGFLYFWHHVKDSLIMTRLSRFYYLHLLLHYIFTVLNACALWQSLVSKCCLWISRSASIAITIIWLVNIKQCRWAMQYCNLTLSHRRMFLLLNKHCPGTKPF